MHASFFWRTTLLTADMKGLRKVFNAIWIENIYTLQSHFCDYRKYLESVVFAEEQILQKIQKDLFVNFTIIINIHLTLFQLSGIYHLTSLPPTLPLPPLWHTLQIMASSTYKWCHIIYFDACYRAPINLVVIRSVIYNVGILKHSPTLNIFSPVFIETTWAEKMRQEKLSQFNYIKSACIIFCMKLF